MRTSDVVRERALALAAAGRDDDSAVEEVAEVATGKRIALVMARQELETASGESAALLRRSLVARFRRGHGRTWCPTELKVLRPSLGEPTIPRAEAIEVASACVLVLIGSSRRLRPCGRESPGDVVVCRVGDRHRGDRLRECSCRRDAAGADLNKKAARPPVAASGW